jgi:hypothetical protein
LVGGGIESQQNHAEVQKDNPEKDMIVLSTSTLIQNREKLRIIGFLSFSIVQYSEN